MTDSGIPDWDVKLGKVQFFAKENNRWPSTTADDESELKLAQWWSRQKYYYKKFLKGEKSPGINAVRGIMIKTIIENNGAYERDGVWNSRFRLVKSRVTSAGKLWSYNTENKEDKQVIRWWNQQKTFYRKFRKNEKRGGMTEKRAKKVEELMTLLGIPIIPKIEDDVQINTQTASNVS